ncbi:MULTISPECIES: hypothetical protein [unclassified Streptomyces]|uniref:hypothetical protein n=1 Tax=unclassified Streptomyces TaxID=2593676 RepID=UPI003649D3B1
MSNTQVLGGRAVLPAVPPALLDGPLGGPPDGRRTGCRAADFALPGSVWGLPGVALGPRDTRVA